jgi:hypothetical protein
MAIRRRIARDTSWQPGNGTRLAGQFQNMQAGIGAVDSIDVAAVVGLDIVGLDRDFAALDALEPDLIAL